MLICSECAAAWSARERGRELATGLNRILTLQIYMNEVNLPSNGWRSWLDSFPHMAYRLKVSLFSSKIDEDLKSYIHSCFHFTVTRDDSCFLFFKTNGVSDDDSQNNLGILSNKKR